MGVRALLYDGAPGRDGANAAPRWCREADQPMLLHRDIPKRR
jgi:hypothetical protein